MSAIPFAIVGCGWRADFYLRIARALPERFACTGMVVRKPERGAEYEKAWGVPTYRTLADLLKAGRPSLAVSSVPWKANPEVVRELVDHGVPVLSETPPAPDVAGMRELCAYVQDKRGKVQVAEQVHLRPHHQAQAAMVRSGKLGEVRHVQVSVAHGYHGISLLRRLLGITFENASVQGMKVSAPIVQGAGRTGLPPEEKIVEAGQDVWLFDFGDRHGVMDFTGAQYFGTIRHERLLARGTRGELAHPDAYYLVDFKTPVHARIERCDAGSEGNLDLHHLRGYRCGEQWLYRNPYAPVALMDDEIAIAEALEKTHAYAQGGPEFYSLAEGCQDHYLNLLCQEAAKQGTRLQSETQPWANG